MIEFQCLAYGVEQDQEGICLLISVGTYRILLDCGLNDMFPLLLDLSRMSENDNRISPLDAIFCSHAHADHAQGLFQLQGAYPEVPIFLSRATAKLLEFYRNFEHFSPSFKHSLKPLDWRSPIEVNDELTLELLPVGHLPGAAACLLQYQPEENDDRANTLLYTGDVCLSNSRLTDGLPLQSYRTLSPDILIVEGTSGTEKLPNRRQQENHLLQSIKATLDEGRNVAIQIDPLGMAQELLLSLKSHPLFANQPIQIWIDSRIKHACDLMDDILEELPNRVQNFAKTQPLFLEDKLFPKIKELDQIELSDAHDWPTILLYSTVNDIESLLPMFDESWTLFWTDGPQKSWPAALPAEVHAQYYQLENHPDSQGVLQLIHNLKPQHVAFCHGTSAVLADLCCLDELISRYHLHLPQTGKSLEILVGRDRLVSQAPSLTEMMFEGELNQSNHGINITLPNDVTLDNRWEAIADSGIIIATWQGENLIIKGISQRELMSSQRAQLGPTTGTCSQCRFYRDRHCLSLTSAMYRRQVSPDGSCPDYQPKGDES